MHRRGDGDRDGRGGGLTPAPVEIAREALDAIVGHAREALPDECCGLLIGSPARVVRVHRARNARPAPTRFLLDPADHFAAIRAARAEGLAVVGVYHSHPRSAAVPSGRDLAEASYEEYLYLIAGLAGEPPEVRLYRLDGGRFVAVPFRTGR